MPRTRQFSVNGVTLELVSKTLSLRRLACGPSVWLDGGDLGKALWQLHLADADGRIVDLDGTNAKTTKAKLNGKSLQLEWFGVCDTKTGAGPFDVKVTISPSSSGSQLTGWRINVQNRSKTWTIWHLLFPRLQGLSAGKSAAGDRFFWPELWGVQSTGWKNMTEVSGPCGGYGKHAMQFMGFSRDDRTLYFGAHDPQHWQKMMSFKPANGSSAQMYFQSYPLGMTQAGNSYEQSYDVVVGEVKGDWFDASTVYADFARPQPWVSQSPRRVAGEKREDREVLVWEQASINAFPSDRVVTVNELPAAKWLRQMKELRQRLGVRVAVHMYHWHQTPFDTNYPDYFPIKRGFKQLVADLKAVGVVVMPYINGRLWDQASRSYGPMAERNAEKISAKRVNPKTLYPWPETYGNGQMLTGMCLHTAYWRNTVVNLCRRIVKELGCGGVYLDQLGCFGGRTCLDPRHGHVLGGGTYWLQGFRKLIATIRKEIGPDPLLTTENNWEGCVADFDALLDTSWNKENNIPIFPAVYWGRGSVFGGELFSYENRGKTFVQRAGMRFVWGGQFGWGHFEPLLKNENKDLLKFFMRLCHLRTEYGRYFCRGRFIRPPVVQTMNGTLSDHPLKGPVLSAMWSDPDAPGAAIFLVNVTRKTQRVRVSADGIRGQSRTGLSRCEMRLAPLEVKVLLVGSEEREG